MQIATVIILVDVKKYVHLSVSLLLRIQRLKNQDFPMVASNEVSEKRI